MRAIFVLCLGDRVCWKSLHVGEHWCQLHGDRLHHEKAEWRKSWDIWAAEPGWAEYSRKSNREPKCIQQRNSILCEAWEWEQWHAIPRGRYSLQDLCRSYNQTRGQQEPAGLCEIRKAPYNPATRLCNYCAGFLVVLKCQVPELQFQSLRSYNFSSSDWHSGTSLHWHKNQRRLRWPRTVRWCWDIWWCHLRWGGRFHAKPQKEGLWGE